MAIHPPQLAQLQMLPLRHFLRVYEEDKDPQPYPATMCLLMQRIE
jgi:hypothetical protein